MSATNSMLEKLSLQNEYVNATLDEGGKTWFTQTIVPHTVYAKKQAYFTFEGTPRFGAQIVSNIQKDGDYMGEMYLRVTLGALTKPATARYPIANVAAPPQEINLHWINGVGVGLIESYEITIGSQSAAKVYTHQFWANMGLLHGDLGESVGWFDESKPDYIRKLLDFAARERTLIIPLESPFGEHPSLYLPISPLVNHDIKLTIKLKAKNNLIMEYMNATSTNGAEKSLFLDITSATDFDLASGALNAFDGYYDSVFLTLEERLFITNPAQVHQIIYPQISSYPAFPVVAGASAATVDPKFGFISDQLVLVYHENRNLDVPARGDYWGNRPFVNGIIDPAIEALAGVNSPIREQDVWAVYPHLYSNSANTVMYDDVPKIDPFQTLTFKLDNNDVAIVSSAEQWRFGNHKEHARILNNYGNNYKFIYTHYFSVALKSITPTGGTNLSQFTNMAFHFNMRNKFNNAAPLVGGQWEVFDRHINVGIIKNKAFQQIFIG